MKGILRYDLVRALRNPILWLSAGISIMFALWAAHTSVFTWWGQMAGADEYAILSASGLWSTWVPVTHSAGFARIGLFYLLPLLAVMPYSFSLRSDIRSGVLGQLAIRCRRRDLYLSRSVGVFVCGFLIGAIPLVVNLVCLACFTPAYLPEALDSLYASITPDELWASLFYSKPFLYVVFNILLDATLCGLWSVFCLALSAVVDNRVALLAGSYVALLAVDYLNSVVFSAIGIAGFRFSLLQLLVGIWRYPKVWWALVFVMGSLGVISLLLMRWRSGRDVL